MVVSTNEFSNWFFEGDIPTGIVNSETANIIKKRAQVEEDMWIACENTLFALSSISDVQGLKNIVVDVLAAHAEYASEMKNIYEKLKTKNQMLILVNGESVEYFDELTFEFTKSTRKNE